MVEESIFRGMIGFMYKLGVYDIILPFLLVFTIIFALLEKTKVLGVDKIDGNEVTKKNINSLVAFVVGFLVIASTKLVSVINEVMANIVLLAILIICFLMLVGAFFGDKEFKFDEKSGWVKFFMVFTFIGIILIFLNALGWLKFLFVPFLYWKAEWAQALIFVIIILGFIFYITSSSGGNKSGGSK